MTGRRQVVTFALGDDLFAADVDEVERVLRHRTPDRAPGMPPWMPGFLEHDGRSLPLVDLRARFGLPPAGDGTHPRVLVVDAPHSRLGLVVDRVLDVVALQAGALEPPPGALRGLPADYLHGTFRRDGQLVVMLRLGRLLTAAESMMLLPQAMDS